LRKEIRTSSQLLERPSTKEEKEMKNKKWILSAVLTVLSALAVVVSTQPGLAVKAADQSGSAAVKIDNFSFGPASLTVAPGTTVTWTNNDDVPHTVVSDDKRFKSKALDTDDKFSYTFTKPGTYNYFCSVHPKMTAKIVVQ
jgi:plastocyanin